MKKLIYTFVMVLVVFAVVSCSKKEKQPQKWEYLTMIQSGTSFSDFYPMSIDVPQAVMDSLGDQGWELVDVYTQVATVHPNFGNDKYVTGLQPNTRTTRVFYVFKRPKQESKGDNKASSKANESSESKSDSEINDSEENHETMEDSTNEEEVAPEPEIFVVNGKEVQLTEGVSTKKDVTKVLGEPETDFGIGLSYSWEEKGRMYEYKFHFVYDRDFSGKGKFSGAEMTSFKL